MRVRIIEKWTQTSLMLRILGGLIIGTLLGLLAPRWQGIGILGQLFVGALKAIAPILVAVLVIAAIAKADSGNGPRFRLVILLYLLTTLLSAFVAVAASFIWPVGITLGDATQADAPGSLADIFSTLLSNLVANPVAALASANYIGILFWSVVFGLALRAVAGEATLRMAEDLAEMVSKVVNWVIQFAPFGILGLVYSSISSGGLNIFATYGKLLLLLVGCMLFSAFVINPLIYVLLLRRNPYPLLLTCLKESGLSAFFMRSSAANIPVNMALCKKLGLNKEFYSVSIPLGATVNMDGAAITITVLTLAVVHTLGVEVSFVSAILLSVIAALGACGTSGIAGGSLLLVPMACSFFGISSDIAMQAVAAGFILGVIQDSIETALNSSTDVFLTATADFYQRQKQTEHES